MKKIFFIGGSTLIIISFLYWYQGGIPHMDTKRGVHQITVDGHALNVEFARTPEEQQRGLMYRRELADDSGMLFLFTSAGQKIFWNKNTHISLDIIWLHNDTVIGMSQLPAISEGLVTVSSPTDTNRVLEVNRGWSDRHNVQIGARMW